MSTKTHNLPLAEVFAATKGFKGVTPFSVGDVVSWKGFPGKVVDVFSVYLSPDKIWWANSYYEIECANGKHLVDFIDAHLTGGGTLVAASVPAPTCNAAGVAPWPRYWWSIAAERAANGGAS
jgi:hypothetical protein